MKNQYAPHDSTGNTGRDIAVLDGTGKRLQTRTRSAFWDKMHLAKVIERPFLEWYKVEW